MEVVQEENRRKEAEINLLKKQVRSTAPKPVPPPFPPELERYSQRSEHRSEEAQQETPSPSPSPSSSYAPEVLLEEHSLIESSFTLSHKPSPSSTITSSTIATSSPKPAQPPPLPYLNEIQDPAAKHRLKKVQK